MKNLLKQKKDICSCNKTTARNLKSSSNDNRRTLEKVVRELLAMNGSLDMILLEDAPSTKIFRILTDGEQIATDIFLVNPDPPI